MLSLYEILKASKTGIASDMWTALAGKNWNGTDTGYEVKELTGIPPLSFTADGTPLLDYLISGNMEQSGTPTPTTPIQPQECGERTGNLYNINAHDVNNGYVNNAQLLQDGTTEAWESAEISEYIPISGDTAYMFNGIGSYNSPCYGLYDENKQLIGAHRYNGAQIIKFTSPNNARYFRFTHIKTIVRAMMVEGEYTSYEPYGYKIPISSANTTTPIYLGEVPTTRKIKKYEFTGQETGWNCSTSGDRTRAYIALADSLGASLCICSHYAYVRSSISYPNIGEFTLNSTGSIVIGIDSTIYTDVTDFKTYLQQQYANGTPVTIWYVLANETTGIVNEPLRKIRDYADTLSMEQAGVSIPTNNGSTTVDVETTLKPSEVYIKYKG